MNNQKVNSIEFEQLRNTMGKIYPNPKGFTIPNPFDDESPVFNMPTPVMDNDLNKSGIKTYWDFSEELKKYCKKRAIQLTPSNIIRVKKEFRENCSFNNINADTGDLIDNDIFNLQVGNVVSYEGNIATVAEVDNNNLIVQIEFFANNELQKRTVHYRVLDLPNKRDPNSLKRIVKYETLLQAAKENIKNPFKGGNDELCRFTNLFFTYGVYNGSTFIEYVRTLGASSVNLNNEFSEDLLIYIPVDYCELSGYNFDMVKWFVNIVRELNIANIEELEIGEARFFEKFTNKNSRQNTLINNKFYKFRVYSQFSLNKNLVLLLLTSLYHENFSKVPAIMHIMQEERLPIHLNAWQMFLMSIFIYRTSYIEVTAQFKINRDYKHVALDVFDKRNQLDELLNVALKSNNFLDGFYYKQINTNLYNNLSIYDKKQLNTYLNNYQKMFL